MNKKKKSKTKSVKRKNKKNNFFILFVLSCLILLSYFVYFFLTDNKFKITDIYVNIYNENIDIYDVKINSNIKIGDNKIISYLKLDKEKIMTNPYIKDVKVKYDLTNILNIKLTERKSIYYAYDKENNIYYLLDKDGYILKSYETINNKKDELLVYALTFDKELEFGSKINDIDLFKLEAFERIKKEFENRFTYKIIAVDFNNSLVRLYLKEGLEIILPNEEDLNYNLIFLNNILKEIGNAKGIIDLSLENPTFVSYE